MSQKKVFLHQKFRPGQIYLKKKVSIIKKKNCPSFCQKNILLSEKNSFCQKNKLFSQIKVSVREKGFCHGNKLKGT